MAKRSIDFISEVISERADIETIETQQNDGGDDKEKLDFRRQSSAVVDIAGQKHDRCGEIDIVVLLQMVEVEHYRDQGDEKGDRNEADPRSPGDGFEMHASFVWNIDESKFRRKLDKTGNTDGCSNKSYKCQKKYHTIIAPCFMNFCGMMITKIGFDLLYNIGIFKLC